MSSVGRRPRPHLICVSKKKRPLKTTKSSSSSITTTTTKKASRLFSGERESIRRRKAFRDEYELETTNSIAFFQFHFIYIYPKTKRERACSLRARTRKRGEPRDAAKRRRRQHHHHRFRRRERKRRSETSSCVIISIHTIYTCFLCNGFSNRAMMRCTRERREYAHKTFFADPFFSLSFSLSLSSSFFTTCKQQQQQQQQPISTRRRERQIGRRCGDRKMGRKRSRNSIAVERVSQ